MVVSENHIARLIPEKIYASEVRLEKFGATVIKAPGKAKPNDEAIFEIIHFKQEEQIKEADPFSKAVLLPDPPKGFLKPRKYDYF